MKSTIEIKVEFGDTDPAEMVFYPNFFRWFDAGTWALLIEAGLTLDVMREKYDLIGVPLVEATSKFHSPVRFGDTIQLTTYVASWRRKTFDVAHQVYIGDRLCAEGLEVRVLGKRSAGHGVPLQAASIPDEFKRSLPAYVPPE